MLTWIERWQYERVRVAKLQDREKAVFAAICVNHAASRLWSGFKESGLEDALPLVLRSFEELWSATQRSTLHEVECRRLESLVDELEAMVPSDDAPEMKVLGWSNLLNALSYALLCAKGVETAKYAMASVNYAYQAVFEEQVFPKIDIELLEDAVQGFEQMNDVCVKEIDFQLSMLQRVEAGERVGMLSLD